MPSWGLQQFYNQYKQRKTALTNKKRRKIMKILSINVFEPAKAAEIAKVADKVMTNTPGYKPLATYMCLGNPFPGEIPPNSLVSLAISEVESEEALSAIAYPMALAGSHVHRVPIMEMTPGGSAEIEQKYRG
jgi:hypothetical protein